MVKKTKKDFDKEKMYSKIMPSIVSVPTQSATQSAMQPQEQPQEGQKYLLRNFIEDIVLDKLEHTITMLRGCECEWCKKDVMALALNDLPSVYIVIDPQELAQTLKTLRSHYEVKVASALIKAVQTVKTNPRH